MRRIEPTTRFRRDFKRESKGQYRQILGAEFKLLVELLASDQSLPLRMRDHALTGELADHRDCHLRPDLVLIYRKPDASTLQLVRLGSHSELEL